MLASVGLKDDEVRPCSQSVGVQEVVGAASREVPLVEDVDLRAECIVHHEAA